MQWQCSIIWVNAKEHPLTSIITTQLALNDWLKIHICPAEELSKTYIQQVKAQIILTSSDSIHKTMDDLDCPIVVLGETPADTYDNLICNMAPPLRLFSLAQKLQQIFTEHGISINIWQLNPKNLELYHDTQKAQLTVKEAAILNALYNAAPARVNKATLLQTIWNYHVDMETHTLETHIYKLRQKIEKDAKIPTIIVTQDDGYCLQL